MMVVWVERRRVFMPGSPSAGDEAIFDLSGSFRPRLEFSANTTPFIARLPAVAYSARIMSGARHAAKTPVRCGPLTINHAVRARSWSRAGLRLLRLENHETSMRIVDAIFRAMQDAIPGTPVRGAARPTAGVLFFAEPRPDGSWKMFVRGFTVAARGRAVTIVMGVSGDRAFHLANTSNNAR